MGKGLICYWRGLQKPEPDPKLPLLWLSGWTGHVNECLTNQEPCAVRLPAQWGQPLGDEARVEAMTRLLNLESTMRPRVRFPKEPKHKASKDSLPF